MDDTCKQTCKFWKKYKADCPFYVETVWEKAGDAPKIVKDCAPKRSVLLLMGVANDINALRKDQNKSRNMSFAVLNELHKHVKNGTISLEFDPSTLEEADTTKQIPE